MQVKILTRPLSISAVSMTTTGAEYCHNMRQKSTTVLLRGPCVAMKALLWR